MKGVYLMVADDTSSNGFTPEVAGESPGKTTHNKASAFAWAAQFIPTVDSNAKILAVNERRDSGKIFEVTESMSSHIIFIAQIPQTTSLCA